MPNWCSNRMYFSGEPAQIAEIKRLASGAVTPLYRRATNEGIQLFLAGSAGLLQITENIRSEQCPGVTAAGRGAVSLENIAFTRWLTHLQNGVLLDEQNCLMLHELWLQSGTGQRRWEGLPDDVRETITVHFTAKRGDWCDIWGNEDVSVWWNRLCDNVLPEKTMPFDLLTVLPTRLDIEVNGFNGGVLNGVPSAYHWYTERYGVKWPCGYDLNISSQGENFIQVDFDTPWCQPESDVVAELSRRFGCTLEHWYAEQGCNFCGWQLYERGELVDVLWGELEWSSPEEIQALADGMEISLTGHEIRTVLARLEDIPEEQRIESGISSAAVMEIINNVSENRQVTVPAELLASLIQTAEQALWKREWAARDHGLAVPECVTRRQEVVNQARTLLKNNTHEND